MTAWQFGWICFLAGGLFLFGAPETTTPHVAGFGVLACLSTAAAIVGLIVDCRNATK